MRSLRAFVAFLAFIAPTNHGHGQQAPLTQAGPADAAPSAPSPDENGFYKQAPGIVAPVLVHPMAVIGSRDLFKQCASRILVISAVIDTEGAAGVREPQSVADPACEPAAIDAVKRSGFEAGRLNDKPVPVLVCLGVSFLENVDKILPNIQPCPETLSTTVFDGRSVYRIGGAVKAPVPTFQPNAEFSDEARRNKYQGVCLIGLIVDAQGNPQKVHILRTLGMGLDEKAMEAVRRYRFRPATLDGKPVPVTVTVEIDFHLYGKL